jgi:phage repressor protein C with HTH and peptisase S24 domain
MTSPKERLDALRRIAGYESLADFARAAGVKAGTARQHRNRDSISKEAALKYARKTKHLGTTVEWLLDGTGTPPGTSLTGLAQIARSIASEDQGSRERDATPQNGANDFTTNVEPAEQNVPPSRSQMNRDIPVLGTSVGGSEGDFTMNGETIDYVNRPPRLLGRSDVFALYVIGDSMRPWRRNRSVVYVEARRAPGIGDYVVAELLPTDGSPEKPALLKELVGLTATKIRLAQYNPPKTFEIDRSRVAKLYRVIDTDELLGN